MECSLTQHYPILKNYKIELLGIGAETAGNCRITGFETAKIMLGCGADYSTVIHELGHIVAKHTNFSSLDMSIANEYEVSVYALTNLSLRLKGRVISMPPLFLNEKSKKKSL